MKGTKRGFKGSFAPRCTEEMNSINELVYAIRSAEPPETSVSHCDLEEKFSRSRWFQFELSYSLYTPLPKYTTPSSSRSFCRHQPVEDTSSPLEVLRPWNTHGNTICHQSNAIRVFTFQHHILCLSLRDVIIEIRPCPWAQFYSNRGVGCRNK